MIMCVCVCLCVFLGCIIVFSLHVCIQNIYIYIYFGEVDDMNIFPRVSMYFWCSSCFALLFEKKNPTTQNKHGHKRKQYLHMSVFVLLDVLVIAKRNSSSH